MSKKIAIIGGGNLGISITEGLIKGDVVIPENITVTRRKVHLIEHLNKKSVVTGDDNVKAVTGADIVIVAVKPKQIKEVLEEISKALNPKKQVVISVVTGAGLDEISNIIGKDIALFRAMPNTAIAIQESMSCVSTKNGSKEQKDLLSAWINQRTR